MYANLFSPIRIGTMTAKNRLLMSAMSINFGVDIDGRVTDQLIQYFVARARGGVGMMLVGGGAVHPTGLELPDLPTLWDDGCIASLKKMVAAVKPFDTRFGVQLMHGGRQSYHDHTVAPSAIPAPAVVKGSPRELTIPEIKEMISSFGDAARRCRDAGFDFIEIHAAHGYLINQFLSPNANHRTDEYGGSFENRSRFCLEVFRDIQQKVGPEYPVGVRINGRDYIDEGFDIEEAIRLALLLETGGAAYLHVSAGVYGSTELTIPSMYTEQGCFIHLAKAIKDKVSIPIIAVGRIKTPDLAERVIREGKADAVALGRSLLADPEFPNKAGTGDLDRIRPCIGCCLGCIHAVLALEPGGCVVNPKVGREYLLNNRDRTLNPQKIVVVGGGPAGMAAARAAVEAGHRTILCEESGKLGGLMRIAATPPGRGEVGDIVNHLINELERLKIKVMLNTALNERLLGDEDPDVVVLATGSQPEVPIIKGLFKTAMHLCTVTDVLDGRSPTGGRIIILGGGQAGMVMADYLAEQGKTVALLNRRPHFAEEMSSNDRFYLRERLKRDNVTLYKKTTIAQVLDDGVRFSSNGETVVLENYDTIIIAETMAPVRDAKNLLKNSRARVMIIGDAKQPRNLMLGLSEAEEIIQTL
ncbi:MAG: FAD-dependent oxidoreductase [Desulfobacteraceae bacterium]|nr:FAD-dependent oxidoreductase [Desulfobacteraceae bacterium]